MIKETQKHGYALAYELLFGPESIQGKRGLNEGAHCEIFG